MKFLSFFVIGVASAHVIRSQEQQVPIVGDIVEDASPHVSPEEDDVTHIEPGIGIHFTTSYAVAAARYQNGTTRDLVKVEGDAQYIELMTRWMKTRQSWREDCNLIESSPIFESGRWKCNWRKASRGVRDLLGLPISRDVNILSNFLHILRTTLAEETGRPVTTIAPTIFPLDAAKNQDFQEALKLAGLTSTRPQIGNDFVVYQDVNAAYAGLGHGLCKAWTDYQNCTWEEYMLPYFDVLFLSFDNNSFSATVEYLRNAYQESGIDSSSFSLDLGWWDLPIHEVPRARFWAKIHELIVDTISVLSFPPSRIVLMGEHGGDEEFRGVVEAALWSVLEIDVDLMLQANEMEDTIRLAARGAAEMAWRSQYWLRTDKEQRIDAGASVEL
ncbi:Nn.00g017310.m01.CDS01 [Neocucurbitaria sp. VM-36]